MPAWTVMPGYAGWFAGSAFKSENGLPQIWYHGTDIDDEFNVFTRWGDASIGFHFGTQTTANRRLEMIFGVADHPEGLLIPVICRARTPLRLRDQFMWEQDNVAGALLERGVLASQDEVNFVIDAASDTMILAAIEAAGYDSVVYANETEADELGSDSLMVWRAELLKSPYAAVFDIDDPRLLPQKSASDTELRNWSSLAREIEADAAHLEEFRRNPEAHFSAAVDATP